MSAFPKSKIEQILRKNSGGLRISEDARDALALLLEGIALEISRQAVAYAQAGKKKAVGAAEIRKAVKESWE